MTKAGISQWPYSSEGTKGTARKSVWNCSKTKAARIKNKFINTEDNLYFIFLKQQ